MKYASFVMILLFMACSKDAINKVPTDPNCGMEVPFNEISWCELEQDTVYVVSYLVYDGGSYIFDTCGNKIGTCNYAWGPVDEICKELSNCKVVYRVNDLLHHRPDVNLLGSDYCEALLKFCSGSKTSTN